MRFIFKTTTIICLFAVTVAGNGQNEDTGMQLTIGADLVSSYIWRGMYQAGVSIQPSLSISAFGLTLGCWGSTDFSIFSKEIDFYFMYEVKGLSVGIGDYWWRGEGAKYFKNCGSHHIEANLGYTFSDKFPLSLEVNTMLSGEEDKDDTGKKNYSTCILASFPFSVKHVNCEAGIGVSPWEGMYTDKFGVFTITAKASKNLQLSTEYALPVFVELIISPAQNNAFLVFGIQF